MEEGLSILERAVELDPLNEFALETFATFKVQVNELDEAAKLFKRAMECSRSQQEIYTLCASYFSVKARIDCKNMFNLDFNPIF